jgi:hypothetical protein
MHIIASFVEKLCEFYKMIILNLIKTFQDLFLDFVKFPTFFFQNLSVKFSLYFEKLEQCFFVYSSLGNKFSYFLLKEGYLLYPRKDQTL